MNFVTVQSEGSLFSAEILTDIYRGAELGESSKEFAYKIFQSYKTNPAAGSKSGGNID